MPTSMHILLKYTIVAALLLSLPSAVCGQVRCDPVALPWFEDFEQDFEWSNGWTNNSLDTTYTEFDHCWIHGFTHYSGWRSMTTFETLNTEPPYRHNHLLEIQKAHWHADGQEAGEEYAVTPPFSEGPALLTFRAYYPLAYVSPQNPGGRYSDTVFADGVAVAVGYVDDPGDPMGSFVALDTVRVESLDAHAKTTCCTDFRGAAVPPHRRLLFRVAQPMEDWRGGITVFIDSVSVSLGALPADTTDFHDTVCLGEPYSRYGFHVDEQWEAGLALVCRDSVADCRKHVLRLWLEQRPSVVIESYEVLTKGSTLLYDDSVISVPGVYTFHYSTEAGCDSTVRLHVVDCVPRLCVETVRDFLDYDHPVLTLYSCTDSVEQAQWLFSDGYVANGTRVQRELQHPLPDSVGVTLRTFDRNGCYGDTSMTFPLKIRSAWFPNAFTPDGEDNRTFGCTTSMAVADFSLTVYNRHGLLVWSTTNVDEPWDGRRDGTPMPQGTYVYAWHLKDTQGDYKEGVGTVLLLR